MRTTLCFVLCLFVFIASAAADDTAVPEWFKPDAKNPYAIFDAWRNLSTTEAVLYWSWGPRWDVCAGCLQDEHGKPIANCPLSAYPGDGRGGKDDARNNDFKTDKDGLFIIYSPYDNMGFCAAPGFPFSPIALRFAEENYQFVHCDARAIQVSHETRFYVLTCPRKSTFNEEALRKFLERQMAKWRSRPNVRERVDLQSPAEAKADAVRNKYRIRVVSPEGKGIPDASLKFWAWGGSEVGANRQTVATDSQGDCTLVEEFPSGKTQEYYDRVRRGLEVDIPGYAIGPVPFDLKTGVVNSIKAKKGATILGKLINWNGNALCDGDVCVTYHGKYYTARSEARAAPDGTFAIERIMPGERIALGGGGCLTASISTDIFTLAPGEVRKDVVLKAPQPAAVRGIFVGADDVPLKGVRQEAVLYDSDGSGQYMSEDYDCRFGISGVTPGTPLRIGGGAIGFDGYRSPEFSLKPGELRFFKVVLKRTTPAKAGPASRR